MCLSLGKLQQKIIFLMAVPLRGGGGKGLKFIKIFFCHLKIKNILLINLSTMDISPFSLSVDIFTVFLQYFPENKAILVQKLGGGEFQNPFSGYCIT